MPVDPILPGQIFAQAGPSQPYPPKVAMTHFGQIQAIAPRRVYRASFAGRVRKKEEAETRLKRNIESMQAELDKVRADAEKVELHDGGKADEAQMDSAQRERFEALILE